MNVINIPLEHKMFNEEIIGELKNFIFDEFSILFTLEDDVVLGLTIFFEVDSNGDISGTEIHLIRLGQEWIKNVYYTIQFLKMKNSFNVYCNCFDKRYTDIGFDIAELVIRSMLYIMNTPRNKIEKTNTLNNKSSKNSKNQKHIKNTKPKKIYLLDEIIEYVNENELQLKTTGTHKINCPCWGVRGHYRHYKSGKTIFVKEYKKGKERTRETKQKIYIV